MNRDSQGRLHHAAGAPSSLGGKYAPDNKRGGAAAAPQAPASPFGDTSSMTQNERINAVQKALQEHLAQHPEDAMRMFDSMTSAVQEAAGNAPEAIYVASTYTDEEGEIPARIINPRTGEEDVIISRDFATRDTEFLEYDEDNQTVTADYDGHGEYEGLIYVTASDDMPVQLPDGWHEL